MAKLERQQLLYTKFYESGIEVSGTNSDGVILDKNGNDISERDDVKAIVAEHVLYCQNNPDPDSHLGVFR